MNKLFIFIIVISCFLSCLNISMQEKYLNKEIEDVFPTRSYNDYIVGENKKRLEMVSDTNEYLNILYDLLKTKAIADNKYFPDQKEFSYGFTAFSNKTVNYIKDKKNNDKNIFLKILIEINKQSDVNYVNKFLYGLYKGYYNLLIIIKNDVNQENIKEFIKSLPNLKMIILSEYITIINYNKKPNIEEFYHAYNEVNEQNYKQIFLSKDLFPYSTKEEREEYLENISYYFKLQRFIE